MIEKVMLNFLIKNLLNEKTKTLFLNLLNAYVESTETTADDELYVLVAKALE